ncbi:MAG: rhomboid family intramembrane serine protease [Acidobacteriota bacterium]|nr:rhomboid family intramembrane serine protease [Acidobacteriota bacterium]
MIPLKDINRTRTFPAITLFLITVNAAVFVYQLSLGTGPVLTRFFYQFGLVPSALLSFGYWQEAGILLGLVPLFTSMFLHGGWMHFLGNMLYLWVFGDNVEDWLGSLRFLLFYLVCGLLAALLQMAVHPGSPIPMIGASGAISGVLAAYLVLFPRARVLTFVPILFFFYLIRLPALIFLGLWFLLQFFNGAVSLTAGDLSMGGTAWWAHIGGFVAGLVLILKRRKSRRRQFVYY